MLKLSDNEVLTVRDTFPQFLMEYALREDLEEFERQILFSMLYTLAMDAKKIKRADEITKEAKKFGFNLAMAVRA